MKTKKQATKTAPKIKRPARILKPGPIASYKVWLSIEPVDADGDKAGEDLYLPFAYSAMFKTAGAAHDLARLMHGEGRTLAPYVEAKQRDEQL